MLLSVEDYHKVAKKKLSKLAYDYYASGSDDQVTLADNIKSFKKIKLLPRVMVDVSKINTKVSLLDGKHMIDFPILIAPTAMQGLAYPHGNDNTGAERATARAAASLNTVMVVSTYSTTSMNEIIEPVKKQKPDATLWYQVYVLRDRNVTASMIEKAEKCGYSAIVVTVDAPGLGNRESDKRNKFGLPPHLTYPNIMIPNKQATHGDFFAGTIDPALNWNDIKWLKSITKLPIIVKGIMVPQDAILAVAHGASAIIVSNHGARQLDTVESTINALPAIVKAVPGVDVYVDGGIRRGTDVLKCLCMGAKAVLIGRPVLYGLAVNGEEGVKDILSMLKRELELAMVLCGIDDVRKCNNDYIKSRL